MNKTISINIAGTIFHIEEDAYAKLDQYLKSIKEHFKTYPDSGEIISDMEARIAEQFLVGKTDQKDKIVTLAEVDQLINVMGKVEDFGDEDNAKKTTSAGTASSRRKLYRDPDKAMFAGVASGLGAYFDIDPLLFRIVFVILALAGASGALIYGILWIIMPEAKTIAQKFEMKGEPANISDIEREVRERVKNINGNGAFTNGINALARVIRRILKMFISLIGFFFTLGITIGIFASTFTFAVTLFNRNSPWVDFPMSKIIGGTEYYIVITLVYMAVILPLIMLLLLGMSMLRKKNLLMPAVIPLTIIWFVVLSIGGAFAVKHGPEYEARINNLPEFQTISKNYSDYNNFSKVDVSSSIHLHITQGETYAITATGRQAELDRVSFDLKDGTLAVHQSWEEHVCIFCFGNNSVTVNVTMPNVDSITASGASRVTVEDTLSLKDLTLKLSGASRATLDMTANKTIMELSGSSSATFTGTGKDLQLNLDGASRFTGRDFTVTANSVTGELSGASTATLIGTTKLLTLKLNGASHITADDLKSQDADVNLSGASRADVYVNDSLKIKASGASHINYTGSPKVQQDLSGSSRINDNSDDEE